MARSGGAGRHAAGNALARHAVRLLGGSRRARVVLLLASVLALNSADTGTIGAAANQLERDLGINHAQLGLLATVSSGVGALACLPLGVLADRANRVRLLVLTIALWAIAMAAGGLAPSYLWLLVSRLLLGAAVAAAGPVVASLTGDFFPPADRAGVLGWILTGELIGAAQRLPDHARAATGERADPHHRPADLPRRRRHRRRVPILSNRRDVLYRWCQTDRRWGARGT